MNKLRHMSIFAHIVEKGSISRAADFLGVSKSVISQHLKTLERELGLPLLKRTTRKQTLTPAGTQFYQQCKTLNEVAESAWLNVQDFTETPQGSLRITTPNALMDLLVVPVIAKLLPQYPLLKPVLISSDAHLHLTEHNIDLAIRVGRSNDSNIKQKRIGQFQDILCGTAQTLREQPVHALPYIANAWQGEHISHTLTHRSGDTLIYEMQAACVSDSFHSCLSLIAAGAGIGLIPSFQLPHIQPPLSAVFPDYHLPTNNVYALHPYQQHLPLSLSVVLAAIEQQFSQTLIHRI